MYTGLTRALQLLRMHLIMRVPLDVPPASRPVRRTFISTLCLDTLVLRQKVSYRHQVQRSEFYTLL